MKYFSSIVLILLFLPLSVSAQQLAYPPEMPGSEAHTYKTVDGVELKLWVYKPKGHTADDKRPAAVFFFGGGWKGGHPRPWARHAEYIALRGMIGIVADYRVKSRNNVTADKCVADAKSAMRWVRANASTLGIDPDRIASSGSSAGGHLAAAVALLPGLDDPADDLSVSTKPNAMLLFNPALILAPLDNKAIKSSLSLSEEQHAKQKALSSSPEWKARIGCEPASFSPFHHLSRDICPAIIFHGTADKLVPFFLVDLFSREMRAYGNRCELVAYKGAGHAFHYPNSDSGASFSDVVYRMDRFLVSLGWLTAPPEVEVSK